MSRKKKNNGPKNKKNNTQPSVNKPTNTSILIKIKSLLKSVRFWSIVGPVATIIGLGIPLYIHHQNEKREKEKEKIAEKKEQKGINFFVGNIDISKNGINEVIYLCPTSLIKDVEYHLMFPLNVRNEYKNSVEDLRVYFTTDLIKEGNRTPYTNPITKETMIIEPQGGYKKQRFTDDPKTNPDPLRTKSIDMFEQTENICHQLGTLNPKDNIGITEIFRFDTLYSVNERLGYTSCKDWFRFRLDYSFKDVKDDNSSYIKVTFYNYKSIDDFIENEFNKQGETSASSTYYDPNKKEYLQPDRYIIIEPNVKNDGSGNYSINYNDKINIYRIEYTAKDLQKKRKLILYNQNNEQIKTYNFPDLSDERVKEIKDMQSLSIDEMFRHYGNPK